MNRILITLLTLLAAFTVASADLTPKEAFEKLKKLEGTWEGQATGGMAAKVIYKVTGAGSALVETQFPGSAHEMVTVYHLDGGALVMTHYCAAGNQPSMKFKPGKDGNTLAFDFYKGSNMKTTDMHMHSMKFMFKDNDHVTSYWTSFSGGKSAGTVSFDMKRVK
jgi:hypothetical protein